MTGAKEPLMHIVKRDGVSLGRAMLVRLVALVFALLVCAAIIFGLTGMNPLNVYAGIWDGAVGTNRRMWVTFRDAAILLCVGFAVLPAFRMRFWNVVCGGTGAGGRHGFCCHYDLWKEPALLGDVCTLPRGGRGRRPDLGRDPRVFQGALEHQ